MPILSSTMHLLPDLEQVTVLVYACLSPLVICDLFVKQRRAEIVTFHSIWIVPFT